MTFQIGDWVVYKENWPKYRANQIGVVREVIVSPRFPQEDWYIQVEYIDPKLAHSGIEQMNAFRLHLGEGDISPWDTECILGVPYGDEYNRAVAFYWERRLDELCQNWKNDPGWDLERTPGFEWAHERLVEFRCEVEADWEAERQSELAALAHRLGAPGNLKLATQVQRLEDEIDRLRSEVRRLQQL